MEVRRTTISNAIRAKFLSTVGDREIRVVASDGTPDRMSDILEPQGAHLDNYRRNPIVLNQHRNDEPVGVCPDIAVRGDRVEALIRFPNAGVNARADEVCALCKAGVLSAVSVGFLPITFEPLNNSSYGLRYTEWEMLELSIVSVPANPAALVIERGWRGAIAPAGPDLRTPTAMDYGGTFSQRQAQLNYEHPELDIVRQSAGTDTRAGRKAIAAALRQYDERMGWRR